MQRRILIVDDMAETLVLLMSYLSSQGYQVLTARNGIEALSLLGNQMPDLIISDIMMPKMGGFEFVEKIRRNAPQQEIPIIFISAKNKDFAEQIALDLGAEAFLEKPVSLTVVKGAIEAVLNRPKRNALEWMAGETESCRRNHNRAPFVCEVYFEGGGVSGVTVASNLSKGGLFLDTFSSIPPGTLLHLRLKLSPGDELETFAEVRYALKGSGVGVQFINLGIEEMELIDKIVESVLNNPLVSRLN